LKLNKIAPMMVAVALVFVMAFMPGFETTTAHGNAAVDYTGEITLSGRFSTNLNINIGDMFCLASAIPPNGAGAYADFAAAVKDAPLAVGTKKINSDLLHVFGGTVPPTPLKTVEKNGMCYIGNTAFTKEEIASGVTLTRAKIGGSNAVISVNGMKSIGADPSIGNVAWYVEPIDNLGLGGIAAQTGNGVKTLDFSFTYTVTDPAIAEAYNNASGTDIKALAEENTFPFIWRSGDTPFPPHKRHQRLRLCRVNHMHRRTDTRASYSVYRRNHYNHPRNYRAHSVRLAQPRRRERLGCGCHG